MQGTKEVTVEDLFIKEKIAEIFVEILKRDWPEQYNSKTLKNDFHQMIKCGDQQTEIVFILVLSLFFFALLMKRY